MKPLYISGIGMISPRGRGLEKFEKALREGWMPPAVSPENRASYHIAPEDLIDREVLQKAKRADRFSKLCVLAAHDAVRDSGLPLEEVRKTTGIICSTALGAHASIFKFLDGIVDFGESKVSPTAFAHSVHNASAAYVAGALETRGPVMTVTQFHFVFHQALLLAYAWLQEKRVERVLVGVTEECSSAMEYICSEKLNTSLDGKMNPLAFAEKPQAVPGEGSVFYLISLKPEEGKWGAISGIETGSQICGWNDTSLTVVGSNGMTGSEAGMGRLIKKKKAAAYSPLYGSLMSAGAFEAAAAALILKNQVRYPSPVFDKMEAQKTAAYPCAAVQCVSQNCDGEFAFLKLSKT